MAGTRETDGGHGHDERQHRRGIGRPLRQGALPLLMVIATLSGLVALTRPQPTDASPTVAGRGALLPTATVSPAGGTKQSAIGPVVRAEAHIPDNPCPQTPEEVNATAYLLNLLNRHRADAGVPPLAADDTIAGIARAHTCEMALAGVLSHTDAAGRNSQQRIASSGQQIAHSGENIATAYNPGLIQNIDMNDAMFMAEPVQCCTHSWNILNRDYNRVGLGVVWRDGHEWLTEDFAG